MEQARITVTRKDLFVAACSCWHILDVDASVQGRQQYSNLRLKLRPLFCSTLPWVFIFALSHVLQVLKQQVQTLKCNLSLYVYAPFANTTQAGMQLNACHSDCVYMKETHISVLLCLIYYQIMVYCTYSYASSRFLLQSCDWTWGREECGGKIKNRVRGENEMDKNLCPSNCKVVTVPVTVETVTVIYSLL